MARINPRIAKRERLKLKLSLEELARKSGVNKSTLHRIESGAMSRNVEHVVERLAKQFKMDAEALIAPVAEEEDSEAETLFSYRSQLNLRVSHQVRNALHLVAWRYRLKPLDIIELAPLLFHIVASETLNERTAKLATLREARTRIADMASAFPHLHERMLNDWNGEEIELREELSIAARDLRGERVDEGDDYIDTRPLDYDDGAHNPFVTQLRQRLAAIQLANAEPELFDYWSDGCGPRYEICREEALRYMGGDAEAAEHIVMGQIGLHEVPRELRDAGHTGDRVTWVKERGAELAARNAEWLQSLSVGELKL